MYLTQCKGLRIQKMNKIHIIPNLLQLRYLLLKAYLVLIRNPYVIPAHTSPTISLEKYEPHENKIKGDNHSYLMSSSEQTFSIKDQKINILCFVSQMVSATSSTLSDSTKTEIDKKQRNGCNCVTIKLYSQK